jgi:hypothetical protein
MKIENRLLEAAEIRLGSKKMCARLEEISGIPEGNWKNVTYGKQRATSEMIQFVCKTYPEMAFWISTGYLPPYDINHTSPKKLAEEKKWEEFDIVKIVKKEPVEWSEDESQFMSKGGWKYSSKVRLGASSIKVLCEARESQLLIKDYLKKRLKELHEYATDEIDITAEAAERSESEDQVRAHRNMIANELTSVVHELDDLYFDKQIFECLGG